MYAVLSEAKRKASQCITNDTNIKIVLVTTLVSVTNKLIPLPSDTLRRKINFIDFFGLGES